MDYTQHKMAHGEQQWDVKYNGLIDALNSDLGGVNLSVSDYNKNGFVFLNGTSGECWYRYIQLGNRKLVEMRIIVKGLNLSTAWTNQAVVRVPDEISQTHTNLASGWGVNYMIFEGNNVQVTTTQSISTDQSVEGHFIYFTN